MPSLSSLASKKSPWMTRLSWSRNHWPGGFIIKPGSRVPLIQTHPWHCRGCSVDQRNWPVLSRAHGDGTHDGRSALWSFGNSRSRCSETFKVSTGAHPCFCSSSRGVLSSAIADPHSRSSFLSTNEFKRKTDGGFRWPTTGPVPNFSSGHGFPRKCPRREGVSPKDWRKAQGAHHSFCLGLGQLVGHDVKPVHPGTTRWRASRFMLCPVSRLGELHHKRARGDLSMSLGLQFIPESLSITFFTSGLSLEGHGPIS